MSSALPDVAELLPHRGHALLLARIVEWTPEEVCCEATFGDDSPYLRQGRLEALCGVEVLAQSAGAYLGLSRRAAGATSGGALLPVRVGYLVGVPSAELRVDALPVGRPLTARVRPLWQQGGAARFEGTLSAGDTVLLTAELDVFQRTADDAEAG
ncbi:MAG: hypothetical protein GX607_13670 [Myxococcales bacterium]|nr:hypothetical protein [Myxococcales bacterium]